MPLSSEVTLQSRSILETSQGNEAKEGDEAGPGLPRLPAEPVTVKNRNRRDSSSGVSVRVTGHGRRWGSMAQGTGLECSNDWYLPSMNMAPAQHSLLTPGSGPRNSCKLNQTIHLVISCDWGDCGMTSTGSFLSTLGAYGTQLRDTPCLIYF